MTWTRCLMVFAMIALIAAAPAAAPTTGTLTLAMPGTTWSLEIDAPGFMVLHDALSPDGEGRRITAFNEEKRMAMSAFLGRAADPAGDARDARAYYWSLMQQEPVRRENVRMSDFGNIAVVEHRLPTLDGRTVNQNNMNAYLAKDGYWADVNLKTEGDAAASVDAFRAVLRGIRFNEAYEPSAYDSMRFGSVLMARGEFDRAAATLREAVAQVKRDDNEETETKALSHERLAVALMQMHRDDEARAVIGEGLAMVPGHAMFNYLLARMDAQAGRADAAMENLSAAARKARVGDYPMDLPDPRTDRAFESVMKDSRFVDLMTSGTQP